ncbi:MAG: amino acid adenylation domain-containing protein [Bacteroidetes bacterium]|nr:amino acid adenylation domain-containing protein [Bacteroidota bacterium]
MTNIKNTIYPTSAIQRQFWLANQLHPKSSAHNIPSGFHVMGPFDIQALKLSINEIVRRHPIFRTVFGVRDGKLQQIVLPEIKIEAPVVKTNLKNNELTKLMQVQIDQPFDLGIGPLIRLCILKSGDKEFTLLITMHHIIVDLHTKDLFATELSTIYNAYSAGKKSPLKEPAFQYCEYAIQHDEWLESEDYSQMVSFWTKILKDKNHFLDLPVDYDRPRVQSLNGDMYPFSFSQNLTSELKQFSRKNNVNAFLVLLSVYFLLLYRYSRQDTIIIGVPLSNRRQKNFRDVMGCFVSIVPIAVDLSDDPDFLQLLRRVRLAMLGAHRNQEVSFEAIVNELQPERDASYNPLFQTGFTFEHPMKLELQGARIGSVSLHCGGSQLDIFGVFWESEKEIKGYFEYCTSLYAKETVRYFFDHYLTLIQSVIKSPTFQISQFSIISEKEKDKILKGWNDTEIKYFERNGIHSLFEDQVEKTPEEIAIIYDNNSLSYREFNKRANMLAHFLMDKGVCTKAPVGIFMERSIELIVAIYGIVKAGGAYVPLDPDYPENRLSYMIEDTCVPIILTKEGIAGRIPNNNADIISLDSDWEIICNFSENNPKNKIQQNDSAYIIYTSGSTGMPKGVINSHRGICNRVIWMQDEYCLNESDVVLQKTPYSFDVSVWEFFWPLSYGSKLVIAHPEDHKDPFKLAQIIKKHRISTIHFVPSMLRVFLENIEPTNCVTLKRVFSSGEALSGELEKKFFLSINAELHNLYGPTEAAVDVTYWECKKEDTSQGKDNIVPIGKPIANTTIYILDKHLKPVPVGVPGELHIGGVQVAKGYLNQPQLTKEKFIKDPFAGNQNARLYKTGDMGKFRSDGNIEYIGRTDFQIKIRGFRVELGEIESVLCRHKDIANASVITKDFSDSDRRIIAYMVLNKKNAMALSDLTEDVKEFIRKKLPDYMMPSMYIFLNEMPLSQSGKINRRALPEPKIRQTENMKDYIAPASAIEKKLSDLWQELLKIDRVGTHDNFFNIGGNSLLSVYLVSKINVELSKNISVTKIFQYPTISALARFLTGDQQVGVPSVEKLKDRAELRKKASRKKKLKKRL